MRFSLVTPVFNPPAPALRSMLASVRAQAHGDWEHCLVNDGSTDAGVRRILDRAASRDSRVQVLHREQQGGIVTATNDAIEMADGEFVAFLDHDDALEPRALQAMAEAIDANPDADYLYSDEDKVDEAGKRHFDPFLKPHWSPARLQCQMYTAHLGVMRRSLVDEVGRLRQGFDGSQDWDLALRISEQARKIVHVREILYHWRAVPGSAADKPDAKPWAFDAGRKAVGEHFARIGFGAKIENYPGRPGQYRLRPELRDEPLVSLIIPTAGGRRRIRGESTSLINNCVRGVIERSTYERLEIVVVIGDREPPGIVSPLRELAGDRIRFARFSGPFNFSDKVNLGASTAHGDYLLILNDDTEVIADAHEGNDGTPRSSWIESMLMYAMQPDVGSVGGKLHLGDGRIQHNGIIFVDGNPKHPYYGFPGDHVGYFANALIPAEYLCATAACLMSRREAFEEIGGFSPAYPVNFGDVDFGLKLHTKGYRNVVTPNARLHHYERSSRDATVTSDEIELMHKQWEGTRLDDPYYHPGFGYSSHFVPPPYLADGRFWYPKLLVDG